MARQATEGARQAPQYQQDLEWCDAAVSLMFHSVPHCLDLPTVSPSFVMSGSDLGPQDIPKNKNYSESIGACTVRTMGILMERLAETTPKLVFQAQSFPGSTVNQTTQPAHISASCFRQ